MPTTHSSPTGTAAAAKPSAGDGVPVAGGPGAVAAAARSGKTAASTTPGATGHRPGPPLWSLALGGAAIAGAYGFLALGMRFGPPLVMVALGGMTLALCAAALWRVIDPLTRDEVAVAPEARAPHRIRELEREKQAVLKAIKEIELDFQMRKISEADYREMVERYRARALRVLSDLAAGDDFRPLIERELKDRLAARAAAAKDEGAAVKETIPAGLAATPPTAGAPAPVAAMATTDRSPAATCRACSARNDADAQFCKKCGTKIIRSADAP